VDNSIDFGGDMMRRLLVSLMLMAWLPVIANTQVLYPHFRKWEINAFGGTSSLRDVEEETPVATTPPTSRTVGLKFKFGPQLGARVTENLEEHWAATLEFSFSNQPVTFTNLSDTIPKFHAGQGVYRWAYDVLYLFRSRDHRIRPYIFGGPGVTLFHINEDSKIAAAALGMNLTDSWKFTGNWGGGAKFLVRDHVAFNAQFTDSVSGIPRYGLPKEGQGPFGPAFAPHGLMNNWLFGVGFIYSWDTY
jgi:opacity protein-like surface antigen